MKLYNTNKSNRHLSFPYKHSTPERACKRKLARNLSSNSNKSRYDFKSNQYQTQVLAIQEQSTLERQQQIEEEQLTKLRQEAYADLHTQLQHYNNEFVARMRYEESLPSSSASSYSESSEEDTSIQELVDLFETGTVKDYSQLIEWESFKNPPNYFECQGEYGDLW